jgi:hypothetical protein
MSLNYEFAFKIKFFFMLNKIKLYNLKPKKNLNPIFYYNTPYLRKTFIATQNNFIAFSSKQQLNFTLFDFFFSYDCINQ